MHISEQIQNIIDNLNLAKQNNVSRKAIANLFKRDLSSYENYKCEELVQAVIDNVKLEEEGLSITYKIIDLFGNVIKEGIAECDKWDVLDALIEERDNNLNNKLLCMQE